MKVHTYICMYINQAFSNYIRVMSHAFLSTLYILFNLNQTKLKSIKSIQVIDFKIKQ